MLARSTVGDLSFLSGGGEMGERIRSHGWSTHPLGPPEGWPLALRTAISLILNTGHPAYVFWGPELYCFYNDAYRPSIGPERHPGSLGRPAREVWDEIWDIIGPQIDQVTSGGEATWHVDALVPITRHGRRDDAYWTYSYSPIHDEEAPHGVGGVLVLCNETTGMVLAEHRLAEEGARQRRLFEQAPGFIIITRGPDHVVEFVNEAHRRLFNSGGWIGKSVRDVFSSAQNRRFVELLQGVYTTGRTYEASNAVVRYKRTSDAPEETRYITFTIAPWVDENGEITGTFGDGFDVTQMRRAQGALRVSEERLRLATQAAAIGAWDYDIVTGEMHWDARCWELFGLSPDVGREVTHELFISCIHPDDRRRVEEAVAVALAPDGSGVYDIEYRTVGLDGVERWLAASGQTMYENGRAVRFVGTMLDITQRKEATRRLEIVNRTGTAVAAELDLEKIVQVITDASVELTGAKFGAFFYNVLDAEGDRYMLYALSGAPRSAFEHLPMVRNTELFAPTFGGERVVRCDDVLEDPRYGKNPPYNGMPEGHLPVRSYLAVPVVSRSGEVHGGLLFGHTEVGMFKAEHEKLLLGMAGHAATAIDNARLVQALQSLNANLEQRVAAEVADRLKTEDQLRQSQKLEAIGQLTGGIAHDFNNLLMVVSAGLNMYERSDEPYHREILLARMREAIVRGTTLTQQLLAFSRKQELKPEVVQFRRHLSGMSGLLNRSLGAHVRVKTDLPEDLAPVFVDQTALQLAILNLTVNARDAMPKGGTIVIRARNGAPDDPAAPVVSISVVDEGVGMSAETRDRMFEPFFTTKKVGKGSGLGLAQVQSFAQRSGGRVEVESEVGRGTTVTLILPACEPGEADAPAPEADDYRRQAADEGRALLVEDDDAVAAMTSEMLEHLGWRVTRAASAEAALDLLAADVRIDLVLSDVMMPGGMSGLELARALRARRPTLPVVLTSGFSPAIQRDAAAAELPLIAKPFSLDTLAAALRVARRDTVH
jgi:PAS domain S-box-containing protein